MLHLVGVEACPELRLTSKLLLKLPLKLVILLLRDHRKQQRGSADSCLEVTYWPLAREARILAQIHPPGYRSQ